jgi:hypothetical protein
MAPQLPVDLSLTLGQPGDLRMEVEIVRFNAVDQIYSNVPATGKVSVKELAGMLDLDFRKVTAMARGDERLKVYKNGAAANSALVVSRAAGNGDSGD